MIMDPALIIGLVGALGGGTVLASIVNARLGKNREKADTSGVFVETSEKLVTMLQAQADRESQRAQEWRARFEDTDRRLRETSDQLQQIRADNTIHQDRMARLDQMIAAEQIWARAHDHLDAPVLTGKDHRIGE